MRQTQEQPTRFEILFPRVKTEVKLETHAAACVSSTGNGAASIRTANGRGSAKMLR